LFRRLAVSLREWNADPLKVNVFGSLDSHESAMEAMREALGVVDWPLSWVDGKGCCGVPFAGVQVQALAEGAVQRIVQNGRAVGSVYIAGGLRHCLLGGIAPSNLKAPHTQQVRETFRLLEEALNQAGFSFADTVRTWFFNDALLSWYPSFNEERTRFYKDIHFTSGALPASTGVGAGNPAGAALTADLWAVQPLMPSLCPQAVESPLQCPATRYGSSFSRAMEIPGASGRRLLVSGTASIASDGHSLWPGNARKQVNLAMEVISALLWSRGYRFSDVTRATAYFKRASDADAFHDWCRACNYPLFPALSVECDVCRDDLLFELEADAWLPNRVIQPLPDISI
jgi:enamine deaminase RidA (YjgF/YER057c/UK114 family)